MNETSKFRERCDLILCLHLAHITPVLALTKCSYVLTDKAVL